jgi:hypothetical protein
MKQLILYFLLLVISSLVLIQIALLFPSGKETRARKSPIPISNTNRTKVATAITTSQVLSGSNAK